MIGCENKPIKFTDNTSISTFDQESGLEVALLSILFLRFLFILISMGFCGLIISIQKL